MQAKVGVERHPQNHRPDVFGRGGFKQVGPTTGAIAHVVAHQIGNHRRVARIILGNARFHLAHQISSDVSGFGVNAPTQLRKQRHKAGAKAVADNQKRNFLGGNTKGREPGKQATHAEQAHGHHEEAGHGTATQGDL